jgi:Uma2 family endonuclease
MPPTGINTSGKNFSIGGELYIWNKQRQSGKAFDSNGGFLRCPTVPFAAWISWERYNRLSEKDKDGFAPVCPNFVIELRSRTDQLKEAKQKMEEWIANGYRLAWLIDPIEEKAYVYRPDRETGIIPTFDATLSGEEVLVGFELDLRILK